MDNILIQKNILFLGLWKCDRLTEEMMRDVGKRSRKIRGRPAMLEITTSGTRMYVTKKKNKFKSVPMTGLIDIVVNKFQEECLLCVVKDRGTGLSLMVCMCLTGQDSLMVAECFKNLTKSTGGGEQKEIEIENNSNEIVSQNHSNQTVAQGDSNHVQSENGRSKYVSEFNQDFEVNSQNDDNEGRLSFTEDDQANVPEESPSYQVSTSEFNTPPDSDQKFQVSHFVVSQNVGEKSAEDQNDNIVDNNVCHRGTQASLDRGDNVSVSSSNLSNSFREELNLLSEEVKAIKLILEQSGVSSKPSTISYENSKNEKNVVHKMRYEPKEDNSYVVINQINDLKNQSAIEKPKPTIVHGEFVSAKSPGYIEVIDHTNNGYSEDSVFQSNTFNERNLDTKLETSTYSNTDFDSGFHYGSKLNPDDSFEVEQNFYQHGHAAPTLEAEFLRHRNPETFKQRVQSSRLITAPPGIYTVLPPRSQNLTLPYVDTRYRREPTYSWRWQTSTIPRSIEKVYPSNEKYQRKPNRTSRQMVTTDMFSEVERRRKRSSSAHDNRQKHQTRESSNSRHSSASYMYFGT